MIMFKLMLDYVSVAADLVKLMDDYCIMYSRCCRPL